MPSGRTLRPQQSKGISKLREAIARGSRRIMLQLPTGGGKTLTSAAIIISAMERGNRTCFTVPAISLIDQTVEAFAEEEVTQIGVIQGDHPDLDMSQPVQVASAQTLSARSPKKAKQRRLATLKNRLKKAEAARDTALTNLEEADKETLFDMDMERDEILRQFDERSQQINDQMRQAEGETYHGSRPDVKLVIVDEAHEQHGSIYEWMEDEPDTIFIGLSATPWTRGLADHWDELIIVATVQEMIDEGFLSDFKVFAPDSPDLSKLKVRNGEYTDASTSELMSEDRIVGNVVKEWKEKGTPDKTLLFACDRAHAQTMRDAFVKEGIPCGYIDMDTSRDERKEVARKFHSGEYKVVCNVGTLTKGVDWDVRTLILARPLLSEALYVQIIGRALRTADGKEYAIILDHSSTTENLGFVTDIHHDKMKKSGPKDDDERAYDEAHEKAREERKPVVCPRCTTSFKIKGDPICPSCGFKIEKKEHNAGPSKHKHEEGELKEISKSRKVSTADKQAFYSELLTIQRERGYSPGWVGQKYRAKMGVWPRKLQSVEAPVSKATRNWVKSQNIRYAKGQKRAGQ
nr:DEAD/DEAH box helicase family protein [uncultured Pelagimonas sp.]